jgi:D-threo-aldose 1-dehydrogenase
MNPIEKIAIGTSGVEVTRLGLGGAPLSGMELADGIFQGSAYDEALRLIQRAYDLGVRYFDTAPMYGNGRSEVRYGRVLRQVPRQSFVMSTKVSRLFVPLGAVHESAENPDGVPEYEMHFDFSAQGVRRSLEGSLKRLGMEQVEILYVHDSDFAGQHSDSEFAEGLEAVSVLRQEGLVKAIGMGMNQWEVSERMVARFDLDLILLAGRYTLLEQSALPEFLPRCLERGTQVAIGGPYNSGILARDLDQPVSFEYQPAPPHLVHKARRLKAVCDRHGVELKAAALQFLFGHAAVATAVPGAATVAELENNLRLMEVEIPAGVWEELKEEGLLSEDTPTP